MGTVISFGGNPAPAITRDRPAKVEILPAIRIERHDDVEPINSTAALAAISDLLNAVVLDGFDAVADSKVILRARLAHAQLSDVLADDFSIPPHSL